MKLHTLLLLIFYAYKINCESENDCLDIKNCGKCIGFANVECVWCAQDDLEKNATRCMPRSAVKPGWCNGPIKLAKTETEIIANKSFNETMNDDVVQLRPQHIRMKVRPGDKKNFTIDFEPAKDYPLDVYFLMDISYTMKSHKEALRNQGMDIYNEMTTYTNNVRFGLGSFVEKPGFPYADVIKSHDPHYSHAFKNVLPLTENVTDFTYAINDIKFGGNYDDPEAGLDALMQVMTCKNESGWRTAARKIIVLCTDSTYHSAGDGKMIGIIKPNDMQCHLDKDNTYNKTMALVYDYPSVSQINKIASENNFIIVFAVKDKVKDHYKALANHIRGSRYAKLESGNETVEIIKSVYLEFAQIASIYEYYNFPSYVKWNLEPDCNKKRTKEIVDSCKSTPEQRTVSINAELTVLKCPQDGKLEPKLRLGAEGYNDKIIIDLEITCKCDCEEKTGGVVSSKCHDAGVIQCGICKCNPGRYGDDCRCNSTSINNEDKCFMNKDDIMACSGRGKCICGKCEDCEEGYSGEFCQYNDKSCPKNINGMCSGNGICKQAKCQCNSDWTGADCSCLIGNTKCIAPYSKEVCSGNGKCVCGNCQCDKLENKNETYSGKFCDFCDDCALKRCKDFEGYVVCNMMNKKEICDKETKTENAIVIFLNKTEINGPYWTLAKWCNKKLDNGSVVIFRYQYNDGKLELGIKNEVEEPNKASLYIAVGSAIGIALLIGILTLIAWKIAIDIHDKREYQKFVDEAKSMGYENVIYVAPTQQFHNPTYGINNK